MAVTSIEVSNNPVLRQTTGQIPIMPRTFSATDMLPGTYSHTSRAMGGYWLMNFSISGSKEVLEKMLLTNLMKNVKSFNHSGSKVWEGFINAMTLAANGYTATVSLDRMYNKVWARYLSAGGSESTSATVQQYDAESDIRHQAGAAAGGSFSRSATYEDVASQEKYGIKEMVLSAGQLSSVTPANQAANGYLEINKNPINPTINYVLGGSKTNKKTILTFQCFGYIRSLRWQRYNQTALSGTRGTANIANDVVAASGQFIESVNTDSTSTQIDRKTNIDRTALDIIFDLARLGDSLSRRFTAAVWGGRVLDFKRQDTTADIPEYTVNTDTGRIYSQPKRVIFPEEVRAGEWIQAENIFSGILPENQTSLLTDPRASYIEEVTFSAPNNLTVRTSRQDLADVVIAQFGNNSIGV